MKKNVFLLLTIAFLPCISCTNEVEVLKTYTPFDREPVTFCLPGITTQKTKGIIDKYYEIFIHDCMICMFDNETGLLEQVFRTNDIELDYQDEICTATININKEKGGKTFYFAVNCKDKSKELDRIQTGVTHISEITKIVTDQHLNPNNAPLLLSGKISIDDASEFKHPTCMDMKCRVARFDLDHDDPVFNDLKIHDIQIENTTQQTYIFSDDTQEDAGPLSTDTYYVTDFKDTGVFYLYPGILGERKTSLYFEGVYNGEKTVYQLSLPFDLEIEANKRYTLKKPKVINNQIIGAELAVECRNDQNNQSSIQIHVTPTDYTVINNYVDL